MTTLEVLAKIQGYVDARMPAADANWIGGLIEEAIDCYNAEAEEMSEALDKAFAAGYEEGQDDAIEVLTEDGDCDCDDEDEGDDGEDEYCDCDNVVHVVLHCCCCCDDEDEGDSESDEPDAQGDGADGTSE
ncbi:hypothetical protein FWF89_03370 [Candidatus Saccharibacteria bacterium]|nr:hypothetical protein [Candidatus Saccharibacteria bacterium]